MTAAARAWPPGAEMTGKAASYLLLAGLVASWHQTAAVAADDAPLWTNDVKRVDPAKQDYERLPPRLPSPPERRSEPGTFRIKGFLRVRDSVTFIYAGKTYRLAGALPVPNSDLCLERDGSRWPCGIVARNALRSLLTSRRISCAPRQTEENWVVVRCGNDETDLASQMIALGYATGQ